MKVIKKKAKKGAKKKIPRKKMDKDELLEGIEYLRNTMRGVATGRLQIENVNDQYQKTYAAVSAELARREIDNPITYKSLWDWYTRWSSGDLPTYRSRRIFVSELINPLIDIIQTGRVEEHEPTGWQRVDRTVGEIRDQLASATNAEQYQAVGLLCRDVIISLAQSVYDRARHAPKDGIEPSATDASRMLEAYIAKELSSGTNEEVRRLANAALRLANALTHLRKATFRDAAMCVEASTTVINVIAIVEGKRDPQ